MLSLGKETPQRLASSGAIKCVSSSLKLNPVQQTRDVARDSIGGHDQCRVERMDILPRDRPLGMPDKRSDRYFGEAQIVGDAGKAVPQDMGRYAVKRRATEYSFPLVRESAEDLAVAQTDEHMVAFGIRHSLFQKLQHGQTHGADRITLFGIGQPQAALLKIDLFPFETDNLATPAAGQRQQSDDVGGGSITAVSARF